MSENRSLAVIIPQYQHGNLTRKLVSQLREHEAPAVEILVVDDGSREEEYAWVAVDHHPNVRLLREAHRGVTAAWNCGWRATQAKTLVFLNNDVELTQPFLDELCEPLWSGREILSGVAGRWERAVPRDVRDRLPTEYFLEGWCVAMRQADLQAVDGFDERMVLYWSDTDLQARLRCRRRPERRDQCLGIVRDLGLRHLGHQTAHDPDCVEQRGEQWRADRAVFLRKWRGVGNRDTTGANPTGVGFV